MLQVAMDEQLNSLGHIKSTLIDLAIRFGPKVLVAILILVVGGFVARAFGRGLDGSLRRFELEPPVHQLLLRVVHLLIFGLFVIMALQNLGVELLPLIAGLGVVGAGVALATQGVLGNAVAGLTIIFTKPYRVGEYIAIVGVEGKVEQISLFSTVLLHSDHSRIVVPNRKIVGEILHNYGRIRQSEIRIAIAQDSDLHTALAVAEGLVHANVRVLRDPAPLIQIAEVGDSAIYLLAKPWVAVQDFGLVESELNVAIVDSLRHQGIRMALPQREVRLIEPARAPMAAERSGPP
jgi:small conductance mechanosensitive channel